MALSKLFDQFTGGSRNAAKQADQMPAAADVEITKGQGVAVDSPAVGKLTNPVEKGILEEEVIEMIRTCYDPEIPVNIYDMGLIYEIDINKDRFVNIKMTLTSPGCPVAGTLPPDVERKVAKVEGVEGAKVELVWDPPWNMEMMAEDVRLELGFF